MKTKNTYLVKASWRATALKLKIQANDPEDAWERAAKQIKRMMGGMSCMEIVVEQEL